MKAHPKAGGISINWLIFGSNGHVTKPEGGVLENYTMCARKDFGVNHITKTITDPMRILSASGHTSVYRRGFYNLDENGNIVHGRLSTKAVNFEQIRINHYFTKSLEEYKAKIARGKADQPDLRTMRDFTTHDQNVIHDTEILSYM